MLEPAQVTNLKPAGPAVDGARTRRAITLFLIFLTLLVFVRLARSAENGPEPGAASIAGPAAAKPPARSPRSGSPGGVSVRLEDDLRLLVAGGTIHRTVVVSGLRPGGKGRVLDWEAVEANRRIAGGQLPLTAVRGGTTRLVLSIPLPSIERPAGVDLRLEVLDGGQGVGGAVVPLTVYPATTGAAIRDRLAEAHVALYDPEKKAGPILRSLGVRFEEFADPAGLALYEGDLVVVGPGGFGRNHEAIGPVLAARAGAGMDLLILDQPTIPGTLSDDLRTWPAFRPAADARTLLAAAHPLLAGLPAAEAADYFAAGDAPPLVPPSRGNFRVIARTVVRSGLQAQEGVRALEVALGSGTGLFIQTGLCADAPRDPRARILLVNALAHLLGDRPPARAAVVYGRSIEDLPGCIARLEPQVARAGPDLPRDAPILVPADWRAPMLAAGASLPPRAEVARVLRDGGTVILLQPQPQADRYIATLTGATPAFDTPAAPTIAGFGAPARLQPPRSAPVPAAPAPQPAEAGGHSAVLDGILPEDLALLHQPGDRGFTLKVAPGGASIDVLVEVPGLTLFRVGRGTLVALDLPGSDACAAPRAASLLARLLTNLGVPLATPPPAPASVSQRD